MAKSLNSLIELLKDEPYSLSSLLITAPNNSDVAHKLTQANWQYTCSEANHTFTIDLSKLNYEDIIRVLIEQCEKEKYKCEVINCSQLKVFIGNDTITFIMHNNQLIIELYEQYFFCHEKLDITKFCRDYFNGLAILATHNFGLVRSFTMHLMYLDSLSMDRQYSDEPWIIGGSLTVSRAYGEESARFKQCLSELKKIGTINPLLKNNQFQVFFDNHKDSIKQIEQTLSTSITLNNCDTMNHCIDVGPTSIRIISKAGTFTININSGCAKDWFEKYHEHIMQLTLISPQLLKNACKLNVGHADISIHSMTKLQKAFNNFTNTWDVTCSANSLMAVRT